MDAQVDPRFGRCRYFVIADPDTMEAESAENTSGTASGGAGIASAQTVAGKGVQTVLTGHCGPNAFQALHAAGIQVVTGVSGGVRDAIQGFKEGRLQPVRAPSVGADFGTGPDAGEGRGTTKQTKNAGAKQELDALKARWHTLSQRLDDVLGRLSQLEGRREA